MKKPPGKMNSYTTPHVSGSEMWQAAPVNQYPNYRQNGSLKYSGTAPHGPDDTSLYPKQKQKGGKPQKWLFVLIAFVLIAAGVFFGIRSLREQQTKKMIAPYQDVYAPNVFINGIELSGLTPQEALERLQQGLQIQMNSWNLAISYQNHVFANLNYGILGLNVSTNEIYEQLNKAWVLTHTGTIYDQKQAIEQLQAAPYKSYTSQSDMDSAQLQSLLTQIAAFINTAPVDAAILRFQPDEAQPFLIQSEIPGTRLNVEATMEKILSMAASGVSGVYQLEPEILLPEVSRADLENTVQLRTSINTPISTSSTESRNHNIRTSFSRFNGMILNPGQTFSFNDVVGPRTYQAGFAEALEYVYGDLVTGIGGGVCQASTTLYQAVLTAGLTVTKRMPHSDAIDYTKMGQDATVYLTKDREIDFQFKNTTPGKIYIAAHVKTARNSSKRLIAEIKMYGMSLGEGVSYRLDSNVVRTLAPPVEKKYIVDKTGLIVTYKDEEKLKAKAVEGHVIETHLEKLLYGTVVERKLVSSDTYRAKPAEYWIGDTPRLF